MLATNLDFSGEKNLTPYCAQMRSKGSLRQHLPFPPTPFPASGKGDSIYNLYIKMRRRYALKVPAARFYVKFLQTDSRKS